MKFYKNLTFCLLFAVFTPLFTANAQTTTADSTKNWSSEGQVGLNFSNVGLVNWSGGGTSSYSFGAVLNYKAKRETEKAITRLYTEMAYGMIYQDGTAFPLKKTDDQLVIGGDYSYKISPKFLATISGDFRSQFDDGYEYTVDDATKIETKNQISAFFAPAYLNVNAGLTYTPFDWMYGTLSPVGNRMTFVTDTVFSEKYGLEPGETFRNQNGVNFKLGIKKEIVKNVTLQSTYNMFAEYSRLGEWVVNWDFLLDMKVNDWLSCNFATQLIYDPDVAVEKSDGTVGQAIQFKHALNIGIVYRLHQKKDKSE
ncbi:DUF3078 domain-containing protein [Flammeovirga agarivorans]|uniref:DUF3078 domain-containing protein n=1 Tax=Flammeovirga agarivorans TaxID=2726742 RepID=A0A7X8SLC5_9BACT|nr:DUF3078 domain-containing protein [Flammeovirga agarivorans]NLR92351.1 DUF3078 domain-containing protein [Flammeovirga agarivorans]